MRKIQKISELQPTISFIEFEVFKDYGQSFLRSELGKLQVMLPLKSLSKELGLQESQLGCKTYFHQEGKVALMFLKSYNSASDRDLIMQLNANIHYQLFCRIRIPPLNPLTNFKNGVKQRPWC